MNAFWHSPSGILNWLGNRAYQVRRFKRYYLLKLTVMRFRYRSTQRQD